MIVVGGSITAITLGSLLLVSVIDKRERALDSPPAARERVRAHHSAWADCALCGQASSCLAVKAEGDLLRYSCPHCKGSYLTRSKT